MDQSLTVVIVTALVMLAGFLLYRRDEDLRGKIKSMERRIKRLEESNRRRMPYEAYEHLLDAMAAVDVDERESQFHQSVRENLRAHLSKAMAAGTKRE